MPNDEIINMNMDNTLKDNNGNPIPIRIQDPEFITETFNFKPNGEIVGDK